MSNVIYFFIGTEAEFIKLFPVIMECEKRNLDVRIIASGQNDIRKSRIWQVLKKKSVDIMLSEEKEIQKNAKGLFKWYLKTEKKASKEIATYFGKEEILGAPLVVHGDTISTVMGARIGKKLGMAVCHVEAGLRSYHMFNPFPEEIDRMLTSRLAKVHFAPGEVPMNNLKKVKGKVINTIYNTIIDSLAVSEKLEIENERIRQLINDDYFVFVMHRQENLMNKEFLIKCIENIEKLSKETKCIMIMHTPTKVALQEIGKLEYLEKNENIVMIPRVEYFDFMKLLEGAQYIITDGGSNQEELAYMGKPTLIMRKSTERKDGLGTSAKLFSGNYSEIITMNHNYKELEGKRVTPKQSPSSIVVDVLEYI